MKSFQIDLPNIYDSVNFKILPKTKFKRLAKEKFQDQDVLAFCEGSDIYFPEDKISNIPLIVHQTIHAVKFILDNKSINDQEMLCYTTQYIVQKILQNIDYQKPNK